MRIAVDPAAGAGVTVRCRVLGVGRGAVHIGAVGYTEQRSQRKLGAAG